MGYLALRNKQPPRLQNKCSHAISRSRRDLMNETSGFLKRLEARWPPTPSLQVPAVWDLLSCSPVTADMKLLTRAPWASLQGCSRVLHAWQPCLQTTCSKTGGRRGRRGALASAEDLTSALTRVLQDTSKRGHRCLPGFGCSVTTWQRQPDSSNPLWKPYYVQDAVPCIPRAPPHVSHLYHSFRGGKTEA